MREPSTEHARTVLSLEGFTIEDIPEDGANKRADLRLWFDREEYVLEAKLRAPHDGWFELMKKVALNGYATTSREIDPWASLSSTITEAHKQLVSTPAGDGAFRVLWMATLNDDDHFVVACLAKRLVGTAQLVIVDPMKLTVKTSTCYHHSSNDFERCRGIDAAVLSTMHGAQLFVNYFSEGRDAFRNSQLHRMFQAHGAIVDPEIEVSAGNAMMLGADFEGRRDGRSQWQYLFDRYGVRTSEMIAHQFNGVATVPYKSSS